MTPVLLFLIAAMFVASLLHPELTSGAPTERYANGALMAGFVDGYQTMDTLAAMVFGIVIALNIRALGVTDNKLVATTTIRAGFIAGTVLALIYGILAFMGADSRSAVDTADNGTDILSALCGVFFGRLGPIVLAAIFFLACFNVCVGLLASCAEYFSENFRALSFDRWLVVFTVWSFLISIIGLDAIISFSSPILSLIYPVALVIIALNLIPLRFVQTKIFLPRRRPPRVRLQPLEFARIKKQDQSDPFSDRSGPLHLSRSARPTPALPRAWHSPECLPA